MKTTQINPANVSISLFYCLFALLSFFILKIAIKYFIQNKNQDPNSITKRTLKKEDVARLRFSKIFLKSYFFKSTFIGSIFNSDKKYMLRQFFVLSSVAVCCFNINSYIIWPWVVGLGVFVTTFIISDVMIPVLFRKNHQTTILDLNYQESVASKLNQGAETNSIQIEYTSLQLSISSKNSVNLKENVKKQQKIQTSIKQKCDLIFTGIMVIGAEIMFCHSIMTLSLSVSNSGILNLTSIGIAVLVDQFLARVAIGFFSLIVLGTLHRIEAISFFQNHLFVTYCSQSISKELSNIQKQKRIAEIQQKIQSINKPLVHNKQSETNSKLIFQVSSEVKFIDPNIFEDVIHQVPVQNPQTLQPDALLEEQQVEDELPKIQEIDHEIFQEEDYQQNSQANQIQDRRTIEQQQKLNIIAIKPKNQTDYFQLFPFDLQMFDDSKIQKSKKKKIKKKKEKSQQKFKIDPYFYFPYEQHKVSNKNTNQKQITQNQQTFYLSSQKSIIQQDNYFSSIDVIDITDDTIFNNQPSVNLVLQERNLNIKTLTVNQKPQIPPTARQNYKAIKNEIHGEKIGMKKNKKLSPYLTTLTSEAIKPSKRKKLNVSKLNKQNGKQTQNSFLQFQTVPMSRISEKEIKRFQGCRISRQTLNGR